VGILRVAESQNLPQLTRREQDESVQTTPVAAPASLVTPTLRQATANHLAQHTALTARDDDCDSSGRWHRTAIKLSQRDIERIETETGKSADGLSEEQLLAATNRLGIKKLELTEEDEVAIA